MLSEQQHFLYKHNCNQMYDNWSKNVIIAYKHNCNQKYENWNKNAIIAQKHNCNQTNVSFLVLEKYEIWLLFNPLCC